MEKENFAQQFSPVEYTINVKGQLLDLSKPCVMGILNVTPDSFYADSRMQTEAEIYNRTNQIIAEGAKIIDVGACSTRPGSKFVDEAEERRRLAMALPIIRKTQPKAIISLDTFRASIAREMVNEFGVDIINDVEEGSDAEMFRTVAELGTPYILMSKAPNIHDMLINNCTRNTRITCFGTERYYYRSRIWIWKRPYRRQLCANEYNGTTTRFRTSQY